MKEIIYRIQSDKALYCIPCYLTKDSFSKMGGCSDWKNVSLLLESHENSSTHRRCAMIMKKEVT